VRYDVATYFPHLKDRIQITLMEATGSVLGMFDPKVSAYATSVLTENGADIHCNAMVTKVEDGRVMYKTKARSVSASGEVVMEERAMDCGTVVWAGGINSRPLTSHITSELNKLGQTATTTATTAGAGGVGAQRRVQTSPRGIQVDDKFRVKGLERESSVFAIGDCALVQGCAPTAQAAYQQGKYLGRLLRDTAADMSDDGLKEVSGSTGNNDNITTTTTTTTTDNNNNTASTPCTNAIDRYPQFHFHNYGALAYVGTSKGVAELKSVLWNNPLEMLSGGRKDKEQEQDGEKPTPTVVEGGRAFVIWRSLYFSKLLSQRNKFQVGFDWMKTGVFGRDISSPYEIASMKKEKDSSGRGGS
jgi:NADH dehydrogenase FAD-containing subunit